jgi:hypothetical protein
MVLLSSSKAKSSVSAWERHMRIARWAGFVRVLSLLLLTSLISCSNQLSYAGRCPYERGFSEFIKSSSEDRPESPMTITLLKASSRW